VKGNLEGLVMSELFIEKMQKWMESFTKLSEEVDELLKTNKMLLAKLEEKFNTLETKEKQLNFALEKARATSGMLDTMYEMRLEDLKLTVIRRRVWHEAIREDE
jgi:hypothetical protein